jgi:hypothetical protein
MAFFHMPTAESSRERWAATGPGKSGKSTSDVFVIAASAVDFHLL